MLNVSSVFLNVPSNVFENLNTIPEEKFFQDINEICKCIINFNLYNNAIKEHYSINVINEDLNTLINLFEKYSKSHISKFSLEYLKTIINLKKFFINKYKPTTIQIYEDCLLISMIDICIKYLFN